MIWPLWKRGRQSLKKLNILLTTQPRNSAHRHPGIHSREMKMCVHTKTFRQMSTGALFYRKKKKTGGNPKLKSEWIKKVQHSYVGHYYLARKRNKQPTLATQMKLRLHTQCKKASYYLISFMQLSQKRQN